jgi:hypothetical protein
MIPPRDRLRLLRNEESLAREVAVVRRREYSGQSRLAAPACPAPDDRATTTPVSATALEEVEVADEQVRLAAESLERRQADLEIRNDLALADFRGPGWDRYAGSGRWPRMWRGRRC